MRSESQNAIWARTFSALEVYSKARFRQPFTPEFSFHVIEFLLTDLMHYCDMVNAEHWVSHSGYFYDVDFADVLRLARQKHRRSPMT